MSPLRVHPPSGYVRVPPPRGYVRVHPPRGYVRVPPPHVYVYVHLPLLPHVCATHLFNLPVYVHPECLINLCLQWYLEFKYQDFLLQIQLIVILTHRLNQQNRVITEKV